MRLMLSLDYRWEGWGDVIIYGNEKVLGVEWKGYVEKDVIVFYFYLECGGIFIFSFVVLFGY